MRSPSCADATFNSDCDKFMRCRDVAHVAVCVGETCNMCIISLSWTALRVQHFCRACGQIALGSVFFIFLFEQCFYGRKAG